MSWNQIDGPRKRGSTRSSSGLSPRRSYPSTAAQNGMTAALSRASMVTWTIWICAGLAASPGNPSD
jgi:hypothetical protein